MGGRKTVLFIVTNGAGLGHLTRGLAVARRLRQIEPNVDIIFYTTSLATEVIREAGFMFYYTPTKALMPNSVTSPKWNEYMSRQLSEIIEIHHPMALVYDGAFPYIGLLSHLGTFKIKSIWIKRECYKESVQNLEAIEALFDLVIVPKELSEEVCYDTAKKKYCEPIMYLDKEEAHPREQIRQLLGISREEKIFYIQLGAGILNSTDRLLVNLVEAILKNPLHRILLGESIIGKQLDLNHPNIFKIRSYPNAQYFKGMDYAISAAGYNTFHELLFFGVPTIFVPNMSTSMDSQLARVKMAERKKACLYLKEESNIEECLQSIEQMIQDTPLMRQKALGLIKENGAGQAASYIKQIIGTGDSKDNEIKFNMENN